MAKVQHGWEHRSMAEVEQLAAGLSPKPAAISVRSGQQGLISPRAAMAAPRPSSSGLHTGAARLSMQDMPYQTAGNYHYTTTPDTSMSPPSKRRSGTFQSVPLYKSVSSGTSSLQPTLAPAPDFDRTSGHRRVPSNTLAASVPRGSAIAGSPPRHTARMPSTPKTRRPPTIRTQVQTAQAEQDAMDALLLMGSPNNGGRFPDSARRNSQHSSTQASPQNAAFPRASAPRQALQYRSNSNESILSTDSGSHSGTSPVNRVVLLEQIEAGR